MTDFHRKSSEEVMNRLGVTDQGLSDADVQKQREQYGFNELEEGKRKSTLTVFLEQFKDFLVIILLVAAVISAFLGEIESTIVIMIVVMLNAILGTVQHVKAEQSLNSLKALSSPVAKVLRNGQKVEIPSKEVVVGDLLHLDAGDYISADGRVIENYSLQINESSLTGESLAVLKNAEPIDEADVAIGDKKNMVFSGSFVTNGRGVVLVTSIGMQTEIGKIANLLESAQEEDSFASQSRSFRQEVGVWDYCYLFADLCARYFSRTRASGVVHVRCFTCRCRDSRGIKLDCDDCVSIWYTKMAKENAIIRKLHAVESLGSISVICSDKTGTLTQNKMTVEQVFIDQTIIAHDQLHKEKPLEKKFVLMALLCNDSVTIDQQEIGDPTEIALVNLGEEYDLDELTIRDTYLRVGEIPFDSDQS